MFCFCLFILIHDANTHNLVLNKETRRNENFVTRMLGNFHFGMYKHKKITFPREVRRKYYLSKKLHQNNAIIINFKHFSFITMYYKNLINSTLCYNNILHRELNHFSYLNHVFVLSNHFQTVINKNSAKQIKNKSCKQRFKQVF